MSIVTIQLGQCGNQLGAELFSTIMDDVSQPKLHHSKKSEEEDYTNSAIERFFTDKHNLEDADFKVGYSGSQYNARAVLVDMEPKVIAQTFSQAKKTGKWEYAKDQQFCQKRGSGNNWAHGYCSHAPKAKTDIMNKVRKEVEKCDIFGGFMGLMSLAGGTGSGVGTYITQCLRDEYPHSMILNHVVWPYNMGEVIVQNYNAILTLSHLYQASDAILTIHNDNMQTICSQLLGIKKVSFQDINKVIGHKLGSILQPCLVDDSLKNTHLGDILEHLVPHPQFKLLTVRNIPQMSTASKQYSSYQWPGLLKHLRQMLIANSPMEEGIDWGVKASPALMFNKSFSNLLFLRGITPPECSPELQAFSDPALYSHLVPPSETMACWKHPHPFCGYERSATLLSNSQALCEPLDNMVGKAWSMFASRAYVHQYLKHGLSEEDFVDCFATLEQVLESYGNL